MIRRPPRSTLFPYTRSSDLVPGNNLHGLYGSLENAVRGLTLEPYVFWRVNQRQKTELGKLGDRKSTRLNSSHVEISYAVFCLKKKKKRNTLVETVKQKKKSN